MNIIKKYLKRSDWDALSFNREDYYDIWALMYNNIKYHCMGYGNHILDCHDIVCYTRNDITQKLAELKDNCLFECTSAFNGFAIYRTNKFYNTYYDGEYKNIKLYITDEEREDTFNFFSKIFPNTTINKNMIEHCEHLFYHIRAIAKNNARIRIAKDILSRFD